MTVPPPFVPTLPSLDEERIPGWRLAQNAVSVSLALLALVGIVGILVVATISIHVSVDARGVLEPARLVQVHALGEGTLIEVLAQTGDSVKAGQVLARLDPRATLSEIAQLQAQLDGARASADRTIRTVPIDVEQAAAAVAAAEARVLRARASLRERMTEYSIAGDPDSVVLSGDRRLHVALDLASADVLSARAELRSARASYARAEVARLGFATDSAAVRRLLSQLESARQRLNDARIVAPEAGVVLTDQPELFVGSTLRSGDRLFELAALSSWRLELIVGEQEVHRIRIGDPVNAEVIALNGSDGSWITGHVEHIARQPNVAGGPASPQGVGGGYRVVAAIDRASLALLGRSSPRRGFSVNAKVVTHAARLVELGSEYVRMRVRRIRP